MHVFFVVFMKFRTKYVLAVAVIGTLFLFGLAILTSSLLRSITSEEVGHRAKVINDLISIVMLPVIELDNLHSLSAQGSLVMGTNELAYLHIYDERGRSLLAVGEHSDSHSHKRSLFADSYGGFLDQELTLANSNNEHFYFHYGVEATDLVGLIRQADQKVFGLVCIEVLLMVLGAYFTLRVISRQIWQLRKASKCVAEGQFSYRIAENTCGDLVETAAAFNFMCARLEHYEAIRSQEHLRLKELSQAVEQSPVAVVMTNSEGLITYANPRFYEVSGYQASEVIGNNPRMLQSGHTEDEEYIDLWQAISSGETWSGELRNRRKDGSLYWDKTTISPVSSDNGEVTHYISVKEDVTAYKKTEERMRVATTVFDAASEAIMVTDLAGTITMVNPAFSEITGFKSNEVLGESPRLLNSGHHDELFYKKMFEELKRNNRWEGEIWNRRKSGEVYPQWQTIAMVRDEEGEPLEFIALFSDISKRKQQEDEIRYRANYDALTGLPNRSLFNERFVQTMKLSNRDGSSLALLYLDLDGFKAVNDSYGHLAGDQVLNRVAAILEDNIRESDSVGRLGGDEFVICLPNLADDSAAIGVAEKIIEALSFPINLGEVDVNIGASIGIACYPDDSDSVAQLFEYADSAMYEAKKRGKNQYYRYADVCFD